MISWIQKTFQQHFRTIFLALLAATIISFIISFGPSAGLGGAHTQVKNATFFDLNLANPSDRQRLVGDAQLSVQLTAGYDALQGAQFQQYAFQRYAALHLADQLHLAAPTQDEVIARIKTLRIFAGANGQFDPQAYASFCDSLKTNPNVHEDDILRVISDDITYGHIQRLLAGPGYVLPGEIKDQLIHSQTQWTIDTVNVDYASFKVDASPTAIELKAYFDDNAFRYQVPPQVSLDTLDFPAAGYLAQVKVTDAEVRAYYDANTPRFPAPKSAAPALLAAPAKQADADFAAVRPQVEASLKRDRANRLAAEAASDIAVALYDNKVTPATLPAFLASRQLALKSVPPFSQDDVPAALGDGKQAASAAFQLSADTPFSDVVTTRDGAAILVWQAAIAAHPPAFAEVEARVRADYLANEKQKRFAALGLALHDLLAARLKTGEHLEQAVAAARATTTAKLTVKTWPAFSLANPPQDLPSSLYGAIDTLQKGQLTPMITSDGNGLLAYAAAQKLPDVAPTSPDYTTTRDRLANYTAAHNASDYLRELVDRELAHLPPDALNQ